MPSRIRITSGRTSSRLTGRSVCRGSLLNQLFSVIAAFDRAKVGARAKLWLRIGDMALPSTPSFLCGLTRTARTGASSSSSTEYQFRPADPRSVCSGWLEYCCISTAAYSRVTDWLLGGNRGRFGKNRPVNSPYWILSHFIVALCPRLIISRAAIL